MKNRRLRRRVTFLFQGKVCARNEKIFRSFWNIFRFRPFLYIDRGLSSDKHAGSADLVFEANLKDGGITGLYVGIIAEHKSTNRDTERMAGIFLYIPPKQKIPPWRPCTLSN